MVMLMTNLINRLHEKNIITNHAWLVLSFRLWETGPSVVDWRPSSKTKKRTPKKSWSRVCSRSRTPMFTPPVTSRCHDNGSCHELTRLAATDTCAGEWAENVNQECKIEEQHYWANKSTAKLRSGRLTSSPSGRLHIDCVGKSRFVDGLIQATCARTLSVSLHFCLYLAISSLLVHVLVGGEARIIPFE